MLAALDKSESALQPFTDMMNDAGVEAEKVQSPVNMAADSFTNVDATARAGAAGVNELSGALAAVPRLTVANVQVNINTTQTGGILGDVGNWISGQVGNLGRGLSSPSSVSTPRVDPSSKRAQAQSARDRSTSGGLTNAQADAKRAQNTANRGGGSSGSVYDESRQDAIDLANMRPSGGGGGGGGGGGSAREDKLLAIEEIRKFIEQVNKAVKAGISGGVVYSTAGNAIPIGGPGEFVKNEGGVNVGTINLRGVWDFADPAAKREIVRQLQEALAQYQKEVA